jgi:phospholipase C
MGLLVLLGVIGCGSGQASYPFGETVAQSGQPVAPQTFERIFVVVMENQNAGSVLADKYYRDLAGRGAYFSNSYAVASPSYPNYLGLVAGDTFNVSNSTQRTIEEASLADLLEAKELTWKNYVEDYPGNCYLGGAFGRNARKHVPFLSFATVQKNPEACANVVNAAELSNDVASGKLPNVALYSPNLAHDGHDTGVEGGSAWLQSFLEPLLDDAAFTEDTLVVVTFDEPKEPGKNIYTVFLGPMVRPGIASEQPFNHYTLLRTIEDNFQTGTLGKHDDEALSVGDVWR